MNTFVVYIGRRQAPGHEFFFDGHLKLVPACLLPSIFYRLQWPCTRSLGFDYILASPNIGGKIMFLLNKFIIINFIDQ